MSGQLNLAIIGLISITFMTIHLFQFRFAGTEQFFLIPPPTLIDWWPSWLPTLTCFWTYDESFPLMVRIAGPNMDPSTSQPKSRLVVCAAPSSAETTEQAQGKLTTVFCAVASKSSVAVSPVPGIANKRVVGR